jgi:hypothetical protein
MATAVFPYDHVKDHNLNTIEISLYDIPDACDPLARQGEMGNPRWNRRSNYRMGNRPPPSWRWWTNVSKVPPGRERTHCASSHDIGDLNRAVEGGEHQNDLQ